MRMKRNRLLLEWGLTFCFLLLFVPAYGKMFGNVPNVKKDSAQKIEARNTDSNKNPAFRKSDASTVTKKRLPYKEGEVLVKYKKHVKRDRALQSVSGDSLAFTKEYRKLSEKQGQVYLHVKSNRSTTKELIEKLKKDPDVEAVSPNFARRVSQTVPNDTNFDQLWALRNTGQTIGGIFNGAPGADIRATQAWDITTGSSSVVVADIDTGTDYTHRDLQGNIWVNPFETSGNGNDDDGNGYIDDIHGINPADLTSDPMDYYGHGTHTAGTIAAAGNNVNGVVGVAWNVKIMPLKFIGADGYGYDADAIDCINYVLDMKSRGVNIVAINASWGGGGFDQILKDVIGAAGEMGIMFVAAAGNAYNNNDSTPQYPASYDLPNIISVAATDAWDSKTSWSNYGASTVHLAAPGDSILSTVPGGVSTGTSIFSDDMENGSAKWVHGGTRNDAWALTTEQASSGTHAWSDTPGGNYADSAHNYLALANPLDLSGTQERVALFFKVKHDLEYDYDYLFVEISKDGGATWLTLQAITGWSEDQFLSYGTYIPDSYKSAQFKIRFRLKADGIYSYDGVYIDDVAVSRTEENAYAFYSGTSMATPHVTGAVALAASQYPNETLYQRKERILGGVDVLSQLSGLVATGGRLNVAASLDPNFLFKPQIVSIDTSQTIYGPKPVVTISGNSFGSSTGSVVFIDQSGNEASAGIVSWADTAITFVIPQNCKTEFVVRNAGGAESLKQVINLWQFKESLLTPRDDFAAAVSQGKIYVFGGYTAGGVGSTNTAEVYDPATDSWSPIASSPVIASADNAAADLNGNIYIVGGYDEVNGSVSGAVVAYNPATDSYTAKGNLPEGLVFPKLATLNGELYLTGGFGSDYSPRTNLYKYNPVSDSWTMLASMYTARANHGLVALNGKLYVFGGYNGYSIENSGEVYDPATNSWSAIAPMPSPLYNMGATTDGRYIYAVNGSATDYWSGQLDSAFRYDPATDSWATLPLNTRLAKLGASALYLGNGIYSIGGENPGLSQSQAEFLPIDFRPPVTTSSPVAGNYSSPQTVTLSADEVATIHYTTDGSDPTAGSPIYYTPLLISSTKTVKFFAIDKAGNSETVKSAAYTITIVAPTLGTVSPASGSFPVGTPLTLTATYADINGATDISEAKILLSTSSTATVNAIALKYNKADGKFYLLSDAGNSWSTGATTVSNSQCTLDVAASRAVISGNSLTLTVKLTPKAVYTGNKNVYLKAQNAAGAVADWAQKGALTFFTNVAPTLGTVSPASGSFPVGAPLTLTATYADANGATDISEAKILISTSSTATANAIVVKYSKADGKLYLLNDAGSSWSTGTTTVSNSQCTLDVAASSAVISGNSLTLALKLTPKEVYAGSKNVYLKVQDMASAVADWSQKGTLTFFTNVAPTTGTLSPAAGSFPVETPLTLTATYVDGNGATDLSEAKILISTASTATINAIAVKYNKADGKFYLLNDAGNSWSTSATTVSNSQCTLDAANSRAVISGNNLTLTVKLTPKSAYVGIKKAYLKAQDMSGVATDWSQQGTLTFNTNQSPTLGTVVPASGGLPVGTPFTLTATYADANGATDISEAKVLISTSSAAVANAVAVMYNKADGKFYLMNDAGTSWSTGAPTVSNSQCTLDTAASSAVISGNSLTLSVRLTPKNIYTGSKNVYLKAQDTDGVVADWSQKGTLTFFTNVTPTIGTLTPATGTFPVGTPLTLTATYADANGATDISEAKVLISTSSTATINAIAVKYNKADGKLYLLNDAGSSWSTGTTTVSNSQCTLDVAASSALISGNSLTLTLKLTPKTAYAGSKNVYLKVQDTAATVAGWTQAGTYVLQNSVSPGTLLGQVNNAVTGNPLSGVTVSVSLSGSLVASTVTNSSGSYSFVVPAGSGYTVNFAFSGYISTSISNVTVAANTNNYLPVVAMQLDNSQLGTVSGTVINAYTGQGVSGATLSLRAGINVTSGNIVATATTATNGTYSISSLPAGNYTAEVYASGYTTSYITIISVGGTTTANQNCTLTPLLPAGQTRIVLTWGASPSDLDSHLTGPDGSGGRFHVFYAAPDFSIGGTTQANLDLDDTSSYGPETTTIYVQSAGTYRFSVHDYSNRSISSSTALAASGAKVTVYRGSSIVAEYNVPSNMSGTLWTVFELNGDTITPINSMTDTSDPNLVSNLSHVDSHSDALLFSSLPPKK